MNKTFFGDCREIMEDLAIRGHRVQCCVTSPPYFGLRDYGCPGQIGLEKNPSEYVSALVDVFSHVRNLLADDGVLWLNLGDSYTGSANNGGVLSKTMRGTQAATGNNLPTKQGEGLKPKDLIGIPWAVAFALRDDGWYLRQDIIWHKPNPMPESVNDRCTKAHEYVFLLSKSPRYYWNAKAMKEDAENTRKRGSALHPDLVSTNGNSGLSRREIIGTRNRRSVWTITPKPYKGAHSATFPPDLIEPMILASSRPWDTVLDPFMGSGTTAQVAQSLGRRWIGCELNQDYEVLQQRRLWAASLS